MRTLIALLIALPLLAANPAAGQDILGPIQDFVNTLTDKPAQPPATRKPAPTGVTSPVAPPVPRPRPPELPKVPVVEKPAPLDEQAKPDTAIEPVEAEAPPSAPVEPPPPAKVEPDRIYQAACPALIMGLVEASIVEPLSEGACGERSPLEVTAVMSRGRMVPLSSPIVTNCQMASSLPDWVETVDGYAETVLGSGLASVDTGTSYMCRNRNSADAGLTSEHGFANAVDVTGFTLADGRKIGVEGQWMPADAQEGRLLRLAHDAACGSFMTVLGPEANAEHHDHLHLDQGCHGKSCTTRICE